MNPSHGPQQGELTAGTDTALSQVSAIHIPAKSARRASRHFERIHDRSPLLPLEIIERGGVRINLWGKFENVQAIYAFKARGAEWFVHNHAVQFHNRTGKYRGQNVQEPIFVAASAGNHAQGLALAASRHGFKSVIFMPDSAPAVKQQRVRALGAEIKLVEGNFDRALSAAMEFSSQDRSNIFVHPYENPDIMAGQASSAVEVLTQTIPFHSNYPQVIKKMPWALSVNKNLPDVFICGVGGGGMACGIGSVMRELEDHSGIKISVIGVQTESADSMYRSFRAGRVLPSTDPLAPTIADGIAVRQASERMLRTALKYVDQVVLVEEDKILQGIVNIAHHPGLDNVKWYTSEQEAEVPYRQLPGLKSLERERRINRIEGAAAAPYAAVTHGDKHNEIDWQKVAGGKEEINVVCILSGGNIDREKWKGIYRFGQRDLGTPYHGKLPYV